MTFSPRNHVVLPLMILAAAVSAVGMDPGEQPEKRPPSPATAADALPINCTTDTKQLPNRTWLHARVLTGGRPLGPPAFAALHRIGVRTIVSVDGVPPDVAAATQAGLQYLHLPTGYDRISPRKMQSLARAFIQLPGPFYVHCHHGKHRAPAAAAAALVTAGLTTPPAAIEAMSRAGTGPDYIGLWESVRQAKPADPASLTSVQEHFPASVPPDPVVLRMAELERILEKLPPDSSVTDRDDGCCPPDVTAHDALLLKEQFSELMRIDSLQSYPQQFQTLLRESRDQADTLHQLLSMPVDRGTTERITATFAALRRNCEACHRRWRDQ